MTAPRLISDILLDLRRTPARDAAFKSQREHLQDELRQQYEVYTGCKLRSGWSIVHRNGAFIVYDAQFNQIASDELECNAWAKAQRAEYR